MDMERGGVVWRWGEVGRGGAGGGGGLWVVCGWGAGEVVEGWSGYDGVVVLCCDVIVGFGCGFGWGACRDCYVIAM